MNRSEELPFLISPGSRFPIGKYTFTEDEIIRFAKSWDPQPFHVDPVLASNSLLGGLCASGWHTTAVWMKLQRKHVAKVMRELTEAGKRLPEFGPSPGMNNIKWTLPVFVGDTVLYENEIQDLRPSNSKAGWSIMKNRAFATNQNNDLVMTFDSAVFIKP